MAFRPASLLFALAGFAAGLSAANPERKAAETSPARTAPPVVRAENRPASQSTSHSVTTERSAQTSRRAISTIQDEKATRVRPNRPKPPDRRWMNDEKNGPISVRITLPDNFEHSDVLIKQGDDERWAEPGWDDGDWEVITGTGLPAHTGVFWIRYRIRGNGRLPSGIAQKVGAAFDLYWDGKLVGRSGEPAGSRENEMPGKLDTNFSIPVEWFLPDERVVGRKILKDWKPTQGIGEHVIALRMSNYRYGFPGDRTDMQVSFISMDQRLAHSQRTVIETALAAGAMSMVAIAGLTLWLVALRRSLLLLFTGLCACAAITQFMAMARSLGSYNYDWHYPFRLGMVYLAGLLGACLLSFVGMHFKVPRLKWLLAIHAVAAVGILVWPRELYYLPLSERSGLVMLIAFLLSAAAAGWAAWRRQPGALVVLVGCLLSAFLGGRFIEGRFFPAFLPTMIALLAAVSLRLRAEARAAQEAHLAATRLELELLKKNLQPHFLLNSLTALAEVVERKPAAAGKLIGDLAGVFRALTRMSGEKQVSLAQELDLCRAHLRVMSIRTGVEWRLDARNVAPENAVPPALFLTLIENGYVHQRVREGAAIFELSAEPRPGGTRYHFISPGEVKVQPDRADGGTGLRYVKARLEESFPGRWSFAQGPHPAGWATVIELWRPGQPA